MKKKILSVVLLVAMVVSLVPSYAFADAAEAGQEVSQQIEETEVIQNEEAAQSESAAETATEEGGETPAAPQQDNSSEEGEEKTEPSASEKADGEDADPEKDAEKDEDTSEEKEIVETDDADLLDLFEKEIEIKDGIKVYVCSGNIAPNAELKARIVDGTTEEESEEAKEAEKALYDRLCAAVENGREIPEGYVLNRTYLFDLSAVLDGAVVSAGENGILNVAITLPECANEELFAKIYKLTANNDNGFDAEAVEAYIEDNSITFDIDDLTYLAAEFYEAVPVIEETEDEEAAYPEFAGSAVVDDVEITVSAPEGVFPEGATLSVEKIAVEMEQAVEQAVEQARDEEKNVAVSYTFDIKVLDKDGAEIQPKDGSKVSVKFGLAQKIAEAVDVEVYHVDDETLAAEKLETEVNSNVPEEGIGTEATVETDGFSYYVVDFTYNALEYTIPAGQNSVAISTVLNEVGLGSIVPTVVSSDNNLLAVTQNGDVWALEADGIFTGAILSVTAGEASYEITVNSAKAVAKQVDGSGNETLFSTLFDAFKTDSAGKTIVLLDDCEQSYNTGIEINSSRNNITLDLNGHTITGKATGTNDTIKGIFYINGAYTFTLTDTAGDGMITLSPDSARSSLVYNDGGTFNFRGGTLYKGTGSYCDGDWKYCGGGIYNNGAAARVNMTGGKIDEGSCNNGGGIYNNGGILVLTGGSIENCTAGINAVPNTGGGGIRQYTTTAKTYFCYNPDTKLQEGCFTVFNCGCTSSRSGGAMYIYHGAVYMYEGTTIQNCYRKTDTQNSAGNGAAFFVTNSSKFYMYGGEIVGCHGIAGDNTYGILGVNNASSAEIHIYGGKISLPSSSSDMIVAASNSGAWKTVEVSGGWFSQPLTNTSNPGNHGIVRNGSVDIYYSSTTKNSSTRTNGTKVDDSTVTASDGTALEYTILKNTVTAKFDDNLDGAFSSGSGDHAQISSGTVGGAITMPEPERTGYTFNSYSAQGVPGKTYNANASYVFSADRNLTASWTAVEYNITYNLGGNQDETVVNGTNNPEKYTADDEITFAAPSRTGYDFVGWRTDIDDPATEISGVSQGTTGDITLYAVWEKASFNVIYKIDNVTVSTIPTVFENEVTLSAYEKTGYTVSGWETADAVVENGKFTMPAHDVVLTATSSINSYTVTYVVDGNIVYENDYVYGTEDIQVRSAYVKEGYTASAWTTDDVTVTNGTFTIPANDVTFESTTQVNQYTITFDTAGGNEINAITQDYGTAVTVPSNPTKTGYTFAGWTPDIPSVMGSSDITVTAGWTLNSYNVTYTVDGVIVGTVDRVPYGQSVSLRQAYVKEGYKVSNWTTDGVTVADGMFTMPARDVTISAESEINSYTVSYEYEGDVPANAPAAPAAVEYEFGADVTVEENPALAGYVFSGWDLSDFTMPSHDVVIRGTWSASEGNHYVVRHFQQNANDNQYTLYASETKTGTTGQLTDAQIKSYTGFTSPATVEQQTIEADGGTVVDIYYDRNTFNVTFVYSGTAPQSATALPPVASYKYGQTVSVPDVSAYGYTFSGWSSGDVAIADGAFIMPNKAVAVTGSYTANEHTVTYLVDGSQYGNIEVVAFGTSVPVRSSYTRTGYSVGSWTSSDVSIAENTFTMPDKDVVISTTTAVRQFTISFDTDGGNSIAAITQNYGTSVTRPANPTKTGYAFAGWDKDIPEIMGAEDITVKALWNIQSFTVTYKVDGTIVGNVDTVQFGSDVTLRENYTKTGFTVTAWSCSDITVTDGSFVMPAKNIVIRATSTINSYTITIDTDGGNTISPITLEYGAAITEPIPVRTGYTFTGWSTAFPSTMPAGDMTIKANWQINSHTLTVIYTFESNDMTVLQKPANYVATLSFNTPYNVASPIIKGHTASSDAVSGTMGDADITETVSYTRNNCLVTVHYKYENGTNAANDKTVSVLYGDTYTIVSPTITGYTAGKDNFNATLQNSAYDENIEITVVYIGKTSTATFNAQEATSSNHTNSVTATYGSGMPTIVLPEKTGYDFGGYFSAVNGGGTKYYNADGTSARTWNKTSNTTLYAYWTPAVYSITFEVNDGTMPDKPADGYTYGTGLAELPVPTKTGNEFGGWFENAGFTGNAVTSIAANALGNKTFYAKWTPCTYAITYNVNEGTMPQNAAESYTYGVGVETLPVPTRENYSFDGWFDNAQLEGTAVTSIAADATGGKEFFAKWSLSAVASIEKNGTTVYYTTLADAVTAAEEDDTIVLLGSVQEQVSVAKAITISKNGNTCANVSAGDGYYVSADTAQQMVFESLNGKVACVTTNGVTTYYESFDAAALAWKDLSNSTLKLLADVDGTPRKYTVTGQNLVFDLNGYNILPTISGSIDRFIAVTGSLLITNTSSEDGIISFSESGTTPVEVSGGGTLTLGSDAGKVILGDGYCTTRGSTIYLKKGTLNMNEGSILRGSRSGQGGGIFVMQTSDANKISINGGRFSMNKSNNAESGIIYNLCSNLTLEITEGYFDNDNTNSTNTNPFFTGTAPATCDITGGHYGNKSNESLLGEGRGLIKETGTNYYIISEYKRLSYDTNGGDSILLTELVLAGDTADLEHPGTKAHSSFVGWSDGTTIYRVGIDVFTMPARDVTLTAVWENESYQIIYQNLLDATLTGAPAEYTYGETTTLVNPVRTGYNFAGWYDNDAFSGNPVTQISSDATGAKTFYAKWTIKSYTISFYDEDGTDLLYTATVNYGETPVFPLAVPTKVNYTFAGWNPELVPASADTIYKLRYVADYYVRFTVEHYLQNIDDNGYTLDKVTYGYGNVGDAVGSVDLPYEGFSARQTHEPISTDTVEKVYYDRNPVILNFIIDEEDTEEIVLKYGQTIVPPAVTKTKTGYTFAGWNNVPATALICADYIGSWIPQSYDITYLNRGGAAFTGKTAGLPTSHVYGTDTALITPASTVSGYSLEGWYLEPDCSGTKITTLPGDAYTGNITLYANWKLNSAQARIGNTYYATIADAITAAAADDTIIVIADNIKPSAKYDIGKTVTIDLNGKTLDGTGLSILFDIGANGDLTLSNGHINATNKTAVQTYGNLSLSDVDITATKGIVLKSGTVDIADDDVLIDAKTNAVSVEGGSLTISGGEFICNDSGANTISVSGGTASITGGKFFSRYGSVAARSGNGALSVSGGYFNKEVTTGLSDGYVCAQTNVYQNYKYQVVPGYTVTYNSNGHGTAPDMVSVAAGNSVTIASGLSATGYTFDGWNTSADGNGSAYAAGSTYSGPNNLTLYAQWDANVYTLTYVAGDNAVLPAGVERETTFVFGTGIPTLPEPTQEGKMFDGWYSNINCTGNKVTSIATDATGPITLYAKWVDAVSKLEKADGSVSYWSDIQASLHRSGDGSVVTVLKDNEEEVTAFCGGSVLLDLNGHEISRAGSRPEVVNAINQNTVLTVTNGKISAGSALAFATSAGGCIILADDNGPLLVSANNTMFSGDVRVRGGYFSQTVPAANIIAGYELVESDEYPGYPYHVKACDPVASITVDGETTTYLTLQAAVDAVTENGTIQLLRDNTWTAEVDPIRNFSIMIGSYAFNPGVISCDSSKVMSVSQIKDGDTLTGYRYEFVNDNRNAVASIERGGHTQYFADITSAVYCVEDNETISLLKNVTDISSKVEVKNGKSFSFDLCGHTVGSSSFTDVIFDIVGIDGNHPTSMTIKDSTVSILASGVTAGSLISGAELGVVNIASNATFIADSGLFIGTNKYAIDNWAGTFLVPDGKMPVIRAGTAPIVSTNGTNVLMGGSYSQKPNDEYVAQGYIATYQNTLGTTSSWMVVRDKPIYIQETMQGYSSFAEAKAALEALPQGSYTLYLLKSYYQTENIEVPEGYQLTLDLHGNELTLGTLSIPMTGNTNLTITDNVVGGYATLTRPVSPAITIDQLTIIGGSYNTPAIEEFVPTGYKMVESIYSDEDYNMSIYTVVKCTDTILVVGKGSFDNFEDAMNIATDGDLVHLIADMTLSSNATIDKDVTFNLNGHTLTTNAQTTTGLQILGSDVKLLDTGSITSNGTVYGGIVSTSSSGKALTISGGTQLEIDGVAITSNKGYGIYIEDSSAGAQANNVILKNSDITGKIAAVYVSANNSSVTVESGKVSSTIDAFIAVNGLIKVENGHVKGTFDITDGSGSLVVEGGIFAEDPTAYVDTAKFSVLELDPYDPDRAEGYLYEVTDKRDNIAQVIHSNGTSSSYTSLQRAFNAFADGDKGVKLLGNLTVDEPVTLRGGKTIAFATNHYNVSADLTSALFIVEQGSKLQLMSSNTNGTSISNASGPIFGGSGTVSVKYGDYYYVNDLCETRNSLNMSIVGGTYSDDVIAYCGHSGINGSEYGYMTQLNGTTGRYGIVKGPYLKSQTVSNKDLMELNYIVKFTDEMVSSPEEYGVRYTFADGSSEIQRISQGTADGSYYKFVSTRLSPKDISDVVKAEIVKLSGNTVTYIYETKDDQYSIEKYYYNVKNQANDLSVSCLNVGACAQRYFGTSRSDGLYADWKLTAAEKALVNPDQAAENPIDDDWQAKTISEVSLEECGIESKEINLVISAGTSVEIIFTISEGMDIGDFEFTLDGQPVQARPVTNGIHRGKYAIVKDGIYGRNLNQNHELVVLNNGNSKTSTFEYSACSYFYSVSKSSTESAFSKCLAYAMALYNIATRRL